MAIGVVSVENFVCSIILMAVSNCFMPEQQVALAEGVVAPNGPAPLAQGLRPRFMGQGLVRTPVWLLANGWSWSAVGSRNGRTNDL